MKRKFEAANKERQALDPSHMIILQFNATFIEHQVWDRLSQYQISETYMIYALPSRYILYPGFR
jgi:hypothetical protein